MTALAKTGEIPATPTPQNSHEDDDTITTINEITNYLKVGDYVNYDPLHTNFPGTNLVEANKLTYTSPTGTGASHGNGYTSNETGGGQTFTAKSEIKWRVLSITPEIVELISETSIKKDNTNDYNGSFILKGGIGYLYAEQELHEACKIYGYGYGTHKAQTTTYTIGGSFDLDGNGKALTGEISGSGARSILVEDLNKIAKVGEIKDGTNVTTSFSELNPSYGSTANPTSDKYYPTINETNGISSEPGLNHYKYSYYSYNSTLISNETIADMLLPYGDSYWIASRCATVYSDDYGVYFQVRRSHWNRIAKSCSAGDLVRVDNYGVNDSIINQGWGIRPIVSLRANAIDISNQTSDTGKDPEHAWQLQ